MATTERWREASRLFDELVELAAGERETRLATLDPALAAAVREMLAADARSGVLDAGVARASPTLAGALAQPADVVDESGATLGPFRLLRLLGRGGMGEVYLAERELGDMRQLVAVKLLKRGMDSNELVRRFAQERRILAQLNHPHVARFLDGGLAPDGRPYYAMEFVEGRDIVQHANAAKLDLRARVALLAEVCDAVAYAHSQLVVHRDLKPSNILVDANGQPRVLDFGIAKLLGDEADGTLTGTGARVMSPAYAAPEQILGEPAGTATDVYSLGVVLFELLTGTLPHRRSGTPEALARAVDSESIERPSDVARTQPGRRARELTGDLDTIALMALRREPARRYATAAALADDLRRWLDGRPVAARPDTVRYRFGKFVRRHRAGVAAAAIVLAALFAGLGASLWQAGIAREQAKRADAEAQRAEREAAQAKESLERSKRVKDFLISVFLQEDPMRADARGTLTMAQAFEDAKSRIDSELADDPKLRTDLLDDFGEITAGKGDFVAAKALFERALALAKQTYGPNHPAVAESLINLAVIGAYQGRVVEGEPLLLRAVAILEPYEKSEPLSLANALSALSGVRHEQGRDDEAIAILERVLAIERAARKPDDAPIATLQNLATALLEANRTQEAERYAREALAAVEARSGKESPQVIPSLWTIELLLYRQGRYDEEKQTIERRLAISRATYPGDHPWTAAALADLGEARVRDGDPGGEALAREAVAMFDRIGRSDARALGTLARIAARAGRDAESLALAGRALAACADTETSGNKICLGTRVLHAVALARTGEAERGLAEVDDALAAVRAAFDIPVVELADAHSVRAEALAVLGRRDEAIAAAREAIATNEALYGADHPIVKRRRAELAAIEAGKPIPR